MSSSSSSSQHARQVAAWVLLPLLCFSMLLSIAHGGWSRKVYVAYLGDVKHGHPDEVVASHHDMLTTLLQSKEDSSASMVYNYKHGFSGFAAMLTADQATRLAEFPGVISVEPSRTYKTTTTHSWDFLGLNYPSSHTPASELLQASNYGENIIVGMVDSGNKGSGRSREASATKGTGRCHQGGKENARLGQTGASTTAAGRSSAHGSTAPASPKTTSKETRSRPGTTTATAHTRPPPRLARPWREQLPASMASPPGLRGEARLAVYKSCWSDGRCFEPAVLAAVDDAIHDGVDVLSLSLEMSENSFATLHAVKKGIVVVHTVGNNGPQMQTIEDTSPWVITVAATSIDRSFPTVITLGNKQQIVGQSLYYQVKNSSSYRTDFTNLICTPSCTAEDLKGIDVKGMILLCYDKGVSFFQAAQYIVDNGGSGLISSPRIVDDLFNIAEACQGIACVLVDIADADKMCQYYVDSSSPLAKIEPARTVTGNEILAPKVPTFSSRGPSVTYPAILKPDIAAPGVNILAAKEDSYAFLSGTSQAAPHVAGIVALLKVLHPDWSPAALKSAIVTTAHVTDERGMPILAQATSLKIADPFDYGGGNINPCGAAHPGLIYDMHRSK